MCVGVPALILESGEFMSRCRTRNGVKMINMMLIGSQPEGTWVLAFLGSAREVITADDADKINKALDGLSAIMSGDSEVDFDRYFPDMKAAQ